eukprot:356151-Rhodomonas_salina.3
MITVWALTLHLIFCQCLLSFLALPRYLTTVVWVLSGCNCLRTDSAPSDRSIYLTDDESASDDIDLGTDPAHLSTDSTSNIIKHLHLTSSILAHQTGTPHLTTSLCICYSFISLTFLKNSRCPRLGNAVGWVKDHTCISPAISDSEAAVLSQMTRTVLHAEAFSFLCRYDCLPRGSKGTIDSQVPATGTC